MTAQELARLGQEMRRLQKAFFAGDKSSETFRYARDCERKFDRAVAEVLDGQPRLFARGDDRWT